MGVKSCSRKKCENIMCDTYVPDAGYVCPSCQGEFSDFLESKNIKELTKGEITFHLKKFLKTKKEVNKEGSIINVSAFFAIHTQ